MTRSRLSTVTERLSSLAISTDHDEDEVISAAEALEPVEKILALVADIPVDFAPGPRWGRKPLTGSCGRRSCWMIPQHLKQERTSFDHVESGTPGRASTIPRDG